MHLTRHTDFALRVLIYTGAAGETVTISRISKAYGISKNHLRKVVHTLSQLGYLTTTQGRNGGINLAQSAEDICIKELVLQLEPRQIVECFNPDTNTCAISGMCELKNALFQAQLSFMNTLANYCLSDLINNQELVSFCRHTQNTPKQT